MIHKVYIVRCTYCHAPLCEPYGLDHRPKYFYQVDSIQEALKENKWACINGMEICYNCVQKHKESKI